MASIKAKGLFRKAVGGDAAGQLLGEDAAECLKKRAKTRTRVMPSVTNFLAGNHPHRHGVVVFDLKLDIPAKAFRNQLFNLNLLTVHLAVIRPPFYGGRGGDGILRIPMEFPDSRRENTAY
jgi:hypothetical protein